MIFTAMLHCGIRQFFRKNTKARTCLHTITPIHIVVVPKKHILSFTNRNVEDDGIINEILQVIRIIARKIEDEKGEARILTNLGGYQDSKRLHPHVSSGDSLR